MQQKRRLNDIDMSYGSPIAVSGDKQSHLRRSFSIWESFVQLLARQAVT